MNFLSLFKRNLIYKFRKKTSIDKHKLETKSLDELFQLYGSDKGELFLKANTRRISIRSILLDVSQLRPYVEQRNLFYIPESRDMEISRAVEVIRHKYGITSIKKANVLHALGH